MFFPQLKNIVTLYNEVEKITHNIKASLSITCPQGCGDCCNTSATNIEVSIFEMLPACLHLYDGDDYASYLEQAANDICPFYKPHGTHNSAGCCAIYEYRPLICRLFGYSFYKNKYGAIVPVACAWLQEQFKSRFKSIVVHPSSLPLMSTFSLQSMMIEPVISKERYPINEAFIKAMEYVILKIELMMSEMHNKDKSA